jgi:hypothetical protein
VDYASAGFFCLYEFYGERKFMFEYTLDNKHYHTLNFEYKTRFGENLRKAVVDGGFTCPNIDGKCGHGGCIFCDNGSGYFVHDNYSIEEQIKIETQRIHQKYPQSKIIAYFQKNTNTYDTPENLLKKYNQAINMPYIHGISIGTRADCIDTEIVEVLKEISQKTYLTVELGMQSANDRTNEICNRGYDHKTFIKGFEMLKNAGIRTCIHIINGLPYENSVDMINTAKEVARLHPEGVKIQLLHVIKGTELEKMYNNGESDILSMQEYIEITVNQLRYIPKDIVIERITGDGDRNKLIAPKWSLNKKAVIAGIDKYMAENSIWQGDLN